MVGTVPSALLLLALPFISATVIGSLAPLSRIAAVHSRLTRPVGTIGLVCLFGALIGLVPSAAAMPVALCGGAVSGFAMFWARQDGTDDDDGEWRRGGPPPPDDPPVDREGLGPIDWERFDRLRAGWARPRTVRR